MDHSKLQEWENLPVGREAGSLSPSSSSAAGLWVNQPLAVIFLIGLGMGMRLRGQRGALEAGGPTSQPWTHSSLVVHRRKVNLHF